ncbi:MAG: hypothetical protein AB1439_01905 [candidate division FCPU426 bacterium]
MWKIATGIIALLAVGAGIAFWLAGWFEQPNVMEKPAGPYLMVYEKFEGEYQQAGEKLLDMTHVLKAQGLHPVKQFYMYFDNPLESERGRLRYIAGIILDEADASRFPEIAQTYVVRTFPLQDCLKAVTSYRTRLSTLFGIMKVYPALEKLREQRGYAKNPFVEIYDETNQLIVYLLPVESRTKWTEDYYLRAEVAGQAAPVTPSAKTP